MRNLPLLLAVVFLASLLPACGINSVSQSQSPMPVVPTTTSSAAQSPTPTAAPTVPSGWKTIIDSDYGYVFSYPGGWSDVTAATGGTHGHVLANRADLTSFYPLQSQDRGLWVDASAPKAVVGCSEPVNPDETSSTTLDGESATTYVRHGEQGDPTVLVLDLVAKHGGNCYNFQLLSGTDFSEADSRSLLSQIQSTFRFGQ